TLRARAVHELDIEWAVDARNSIQLLQVRPVTCKPSRSIVLDNANICESYPGLTRPLTFSMIRAAYRDILAHACDELGVPRDLVDQHRDGFEDLICLIKGRVYLNLNSWYRMYRLVPGFEPALRNWESSMGLALADDALPLPPVGGALRIALARGRVARR